MRIKDICAELGISRVTLHMHVKSGIFPQGERVGPKALRWRRSVVLDAIARMNEGRRIRLDADA